MLYTQKNRALQFILDLASSVHCSTDVAMTALELRLEHIFHSLSGKGMETNWHPKMTETRG